MPDLEELLQSRNKKKFMKKSYRPWDLSGGPTSLTENNEFGTTNLENPVRQKDSVVDNNLSVVAQCISQDNIYSTLDDNKDIKKITNKYQLGTDSENHGISNEYQMDNSTDNIKETTRNHLDNKIDINNISNIQSTLDKFTKETSEIKNNFKENLEYNHNEIDFISPSKLEQEIIRLSGKQKLIFDMVIEICSARKCFETGPVQTVTLATLAQTTTGTAKTTIKRLIDKGLIFRHPGKNAKGGYINLGINQLIWEHVKNIKNNNKTSIFTSEAILNNRYQKDINPDDISSSIYNINTTTLTKRHEQIPQEWEKINFEPLSHIGFSKTQIKQLIGKNEPTIVQESIYHFAFGLEYNQKTKKYDDPLNVLMGVLRKGQAWIEGDYRSAIEIAQEKLLESKKAEIERKKDLEEKAFKLAFHEWESEITESELQKLTERKNGDLTPPKAKLTMYFRENIWPSKKGEYLLI
ncbi:TPA: hypothetical protein JBA93_15145 [Legionella pneumophila subsp. pneumophila]|nr:hypothetical protein [Legionella pneumophila subsp. pneumophila]